MASADYFGTRFKGQTETGDGFLSPFRLSKVTPYFIGRLLRSYFRLASRELAPIGFSRKCEPDSRKRENSLAKRTNNQKKAGQLSCLLFLVIHYI